MFKKKKRSLLAMLYQLTL